MRFAPRLVAVLGAAGLVSALLAGSAPAGAAPGRADAGPVTRPPHLRSVTLVTGDRVLLGSPGRPSYGEVVPGPGRRAMTFLTHRVGGRLFVVPADALALVTAGRLDRRLFDVTGLVAAGEGGAAGVPLTVAYSARRRSGPHVRTARERRDGRWWSAVRPRDPAIPSFRGGVSQVRLDDGGPRRAGDASRPAAGSDAGTSPKPPADEGSRTYDLTIRHLDQAGQPTDGFGDLVFGLDADVLEFPMGAGARGTTRLRLPKGRYHLESTVASGDKADPDFHTVVRPLLTLDRDRTVTVDARATRPVSVAAPRPSAQLALVDLGYRRQVGGRSLESGILSRRLDDTFTAHAGPAVEPDELVDRIHVQWAEPDGRGGFTDSPYLYAYFWQVRGRYLTGFRRSVPETDLARVASRHVAQPGGRRALRFFAPRSADGFGGWSVGIPYSMPSRVTAHLMAGGVRWSGALIHVGPGSHEGDEETWLSSGWRAYTAGTSYGQRWNAAVLGPALAAPSHDPPLARYGDRIDVRIPMYADQAGHLGGSRTDEGHTTLYRDGVVVGRSDVPGNGEFRVPPGRARYRLATTATRTVAGLSTDIRTAWTFDSQRTGRDGRLLPVSVPRFALPVDERNRIAAGATLLPLTVESQLGGTPGAAAGTGARADVRTLTVSVSPDDGRTWTPAPVVRRDGRHWVAAAWIPPGPGYLSLRTRVVNLAGNSSEQTVLRAAAVR